MCVFSALVFCGQPPQSFPWLLTIPSSWLTLRLRRKALLWFLMSLCTRDKVPSSGFHCAGETQHMRMDTSQFVSKYLRTLWSEDCLSFWLSLNLNLRRRTVGKSESLLIPLPRASIDPFSWHFCMSALSTGGFCMTLYEYLLRLTWLTAHVCSHDNVLAIRFFHRSGTFC